MKRSIPEPDTPTTGTAATKKTLTAAIWKLPPKERYTVHFITDTGEQVSRFLYRSKELALEKRDPHPRRKLLRR